MRERLLAPPPLPPPLPPRPLLELVSELLCRDAAEAGSLDRPRYGEATATTAAPSGLALAYPGLVLDLHHRHLASITEFHVFVGLRTTGEAFAWDQRNKRVLAWIARARHVARYCGSRHVPHQAGSREFLHLGPLLGPGSDAEGPGVWQPADW